MKLQIIASIAVLILPVAAAACSKRGPDVPGASADPNAVEQAHSLKELLEIVKAGSKPRANPDSLPPEVAADSLARREDCELDAATELRIRDLEEKLNDLRLRYTDRHPDVLATSRGLEELKQAALSNCVDRLQ